MKRKSRVQAPVALACVLLTVQLLLILSGCGAPPRPELPVDAVALEMGALVDPADDDAAYGTIEYEGRLYIAYGTLTGTLQARDIDRCVGYIVADENSTSVPDPEDTSRRIYTLAADPRHDFLLEHDATTRLMNQPTFWRAVDTQGRAIPVPAFIESLEYPYWNEP